jgi:hypothetical protein
MLAYFLFFFYLFSGTILLHFIIRRKKFPFTIYHTASILFFKVFLGCLYGYIFLHFYKGDDTWGYFTESKEATTLLLKHPGKFFQECWPAYSLQKTDHDVWKAVLYYIKHFETWFFVKGLAILNLLSGKNYYIDVLWFEFLTIPGSLLLFSLLARLFPLKTGMNFLLIFFLPSIVFWCSGIRAEAIILLGIVLILYNGEAYARKPGIGNVMGILTGFGLLLLFRYQFLVALVPLFFAYLISMRKNESRPTLFVRIFGVACLIFGASLFFPPRYQLSLPIQRAQANFFQLDGNTRYALDSLKPGPVSFIKILPQAIANAILRPYPWEGKNTMQSVSSVEVIFLIAGIFYFLLSPGRKQQISHPLYWFFIFYGISQLLIIGYVVPFPGAIVRYRSIPLLLLFLFLYAGNPLLQQKIRYMIFKLH